MYVLGIDLYLMGKRYYPLIVILPTCMCSQPTIASIVWNAEQQKRDKRNQVWLPLLHDFVVS